MNEQPLQSPLEELSAVPDVWRDEVQARLERYKKRRGRRIEGAFTMRFPFPPTEPESASCEDEPEAQEIESPDSVVINEIIAANNLDNALMIVAEPGEAIATIPSEEADPSSDTPSPLLVAPSSCRPMEPDPEEEPVSLIELAPRPVPRRKVIAFPSSPHLQAEFPRRIADPVQPEQLRILDVPEELQAIPATAFLEGLLGAPSAATPQSLNDAGELPCPPLRAPRRVGAASIDTVVTLAGAALCAAAAARFLRELPSMKFLILGAVSISVLLWTSYQYLFLVYCGRTPGMAAAHVHLRTFKGQFPDFRRRQLRVVGLYLSVLSLGMGVLWYFVDVESLCWQDRISQTFPAAADKP